MGKESYGCLWIYFRHLCTERVCVAVFLGMGLLFHMFSRLHTSELHIPLPVTERRTSGGPQFPARHFRFPKCNTPIIQFDEALNLKKTKRIIYLEKYIKNFDQNYTIVSNHRRRFSGYPCYQFVCPVGRHIGFSNFYKLTKFMKLYRDFISCLLYTSPSPRD